MLRTGRTSEAIPKLRHALELHEALARAKPASVSQRSALSNALPGVGRAEAAAGRPAEALAAFDRAVEVDRSLAETYPVSRYNLACSLALMIPDASPERREDLVRRGVEAFQQARAAGYANVTSIKTDADLDPLRSRPEFRDLLLDAVFPADPFAR